MPDNTSLLSLCDVLIAGEKHFSGLIMSPILGKEVIEFSLPVATREGILVSPRVTVALKMCFSGYIHLKPISLYASASKVSIF